MSTATRLRRLGAAAAMATASGGGLLLLNQPSLAVNDRGGGSALSAVQQKIADPNAVVPPRTVQESALIGASSANPLDVLVIGGGATGAGVALDAVTRGLRVGLVEREDFASGTSSRSTKLIHGGVRYLEKAVFNFDYGQLKLVFHALEERKQVIENAPHLCHALPCMTPCFDWFEVVYYWSGLKLYDLVAGARLLHLSRYYSAQESVELFPTLARKGKDRSLKGTVVYYDGQMNDSRLNVGLACTAALAGAAVLNHAEVVSFLKDEVSNRIIGARIRDNLTGKEFDTYAKVVVNAAGPFCDSVRKLADKEARPMICPSSGVHIVLPDYYSPEGMGLIVPKTKDGRVVFMLPWLGRTVAGTTDSNTTITLLPEPHEDEIQFILDAICDYLNVKVRRTDVLSAWSGIRPLATDPSAKNTESISRDHVVCEEYPGLVTITGGKWTTYRSMAEDAVDAAIKSGKLSPTNECLTSKLCIIGGEGWDPASFTVLAQQYIRMKKSHGGKVVPGVMDTAAAKHLSHAYGTMAERVAAIAQAFRRDEIANKFRNATEQIEVALCEIPYKKLAISEEVREQIELVHSQFKRAKERTESLDPQLDMDLVMAQKEDDPDPAILKRLTDKLHLRTINDLKRESVAFHEMVIMSDGDPGDSFEKMPSLLKKLMDYVLSENPPVNDTPENDKGLVKHRSPVIPDDFRCPISLELMKDPVIVSTGQTYERSCIQKWLEAGHKTCPKTQQTLLHTALTPNYVLKSLISLWCESNGVELPKNRENCRSKKSGSSISDCDRAAIDELLEKLAIGDREQQRAAAGELCLLAKRNADNRVCIAEAGAIPLLVELLSSTDSQTQEHAVTALLNLSINDINKGTIVNAGAIPDIVDVLKNGSMEARENAAATLFSLSVIDENKVAIGAAGAIPALIKLLCEGTPRGKKDAATAIFNLSIYQGNKARAVRAGIVSPLMSLLKDAGGGMVDEALAILAILASHQEGKMAIGQAEPIPVLVEVIRTGSPHNRENAAAVLWSLCTGDIQQLKLAKELGAEEALKELSENGTDRAKRKAGSILELLQRIEVTIDPQIL